MISKEKKNNIRSFRFSDRIMGIIEEQDGETFSDKLSNLINISYEKLPEINRQIADKKQELKQLNKMINVRKTSILSHLQDIEAHTATSQRSLEQVAEKIKDMNEDSRI